MPNERSVSIGYGRPPGRVESAYHSRTQSSDVKILPTMPILYYMRITYSEA